MVWLNGLFWGIRAAFWEGSFTSGRFYHFGRHFVKSYKTRSASSFNKNYTLSEYLHCLQGCHKFRFRKYDYYSEEVTTIF